MHHHLPAKAPRAKTLVAMIGGMEAVVSFPP